MSKGGKQMDSRVASPETRLAAPRVSLRVILRATIIHEEQRTPSEDELDRVANSLTESSHLAGKALSIPALQPHLSHQNSSTAFALEQQLWAYLAGNKSRYWDLLNHGQLVDIGPFEAPLDESSSEIRVLKVSRHFKDGGDESETFKADLVRVSLDDDPAYLAISYAWGDPSIVGHFASHHKDKKRQIAYSRGVFDIINTILAWDTTLYLWIDALCINQEDLSERESQVAMMGKIFSQARQVVAFLGQADDMSTTAMDFMLLAANSIWAHRSPDHSFTISGIGRLVSEIGSRVEDTVSIKGLISRPWFHRCWVVQEVALGNDPVLICGKHALSLCALSTLLKSIILVFRYSAMCDLDQMYSHDFMTAILSLGSTAGIHVARQGQKGNEFQLPFLHSLATLSATFEASDPRDRIYALLGLNSAKRYRNALRPDYGIAVEDLYTNLAREILVQDGNINFLHSAGIVYRPSLSLPSWVPDWTSVPAHKIHHGDLLGPPAQIWGIKDSQTRFSFDPASPLVLNLYGDVVDSIKLIIRDPFPYYYSLGETFCLTLATAYVEAVMELIQTSQTKGQLVTLNKSPWKKPLLETLSASGAPWMDFWNYWAKVIDDKGTLKTAKATEAGFDAFIERINRWHRERRAVGMPSEEEDDFTGLFFLAVTGRRFFVSSEGHFGLATEGAQVGDFVCAFEGHRVPFVVRSVDVEDLSKGYRLVGEAVSRFLPFFFVN